jgi:hypothetical protein
MVHTAAHIKGFDVKEFKKTMLKAFSRATYLTNETGHLLIEAEKGLTQSELIEMKGMIKGKADSLTATRQQTKRTLRPKAKAGNKKRKKRT